jgi:glycyl-tRNA synthetase
MAKKENNNELMEKIVSLCKRRGFIFPGSEIYGGMANSWDYGPLGVELKNNIKEAWWKKFVHERTDMVGIDAALIMNPKVWEASGHLKNFTDPLVECKKCHERFRADKLIEQAQGGKFLDLLEKYIKTQDAALQDPKMLKILREIAEKGEAVVEGGEKKKIPSELAENFLKGTYAKDILTAIHGMLDFYNLKCPNCGSEHQWTPPNSFNLMLKTFIGPAEESANVAYFRPETAQAMFVDFKQVLETSRKRIPFGIAQIGKAFRNEITPGNFIFRTREFEQMEIEYFIREKDWKKSFDYWHKEMYQWMAELGLEKKHLHDLEVPDKERAHYSKRTIDIEYDFPFGTDELYGLAYRTDFDLGNHIKGSGQNLEYMDPETQEKFIPHVIEPTFGVDRSVLAVLCESYTEEEAPTAEKGETETRVVLKFPKWLAPIKVAILPLSKKEELAKVAQPLYEDLVKTFVCEYDETQSIGKRYRRQDEIGTPYCVTIDFETLEDKAVTVRDRDTMKQERIKIEELTDCLKNKLSA